jgi:hypothetical protein
LLDLSGKNLSIFGVDFKLGLFFDTVFNEGLNQFEVFIEFLLFQNFFELRVNLKGEFLVGFEGPF